MHQLLTVVVAAQLGAALPADSLRRLEANAREAEARFERLSRSLAPLSRGGFSGRDCDEVIGRFCLRYDSTSVRPPATELGPVVDSRREAIEAARRYFSAAPGALAAAGPLVRLLISDGRAREAVSAAGTFAVLSADTLWAHLLLGLAHYTAGEAVEAEQAFVRALEQMEPAEQRRWLEPEWLLDPAERRRLNRLADAQRAEYERRFWIVSDPLWLTPPNERWLEHMARHVEARLLARVRPVGGMLPWGRDLDELTVRYGTPASRAQVQSSSLQFDARNSFVEYFDTAQRAYSPERWLVEGFAEPQPPGEPPLLYAARARSAMALRTVTRVLHLPHQVTRFVADGQVVLRVDVQLPPLPADSTRPAAVARGPGSTAAAALFVYDSAFTRRVDERTTVQWQRDSQTVALQVTVGAGRLYYGIEVLDTAADYAATARYSVDADLATRGPLISDLLITQPFGAGSLPDGRADPRLAGRAALVFTAADTLGVYAEAYRLSRAGADAVRVEVSLERAEGPSLIGRFARWIGRTAGVWRPPAEPSVSWRTRMAEGIFPIALDVPLAGQRSGLHAVRVKITDLAGGASAESRRLILIR